MKITLINRKNKIIALLLSALLLGACSSGNPDSHKTSTSQHGMEAEPEIEKGPHNGRLLHSGDFTLELAIFETGVPPEFRVWAKYQGKSIKPQDIDLNIKLIRLGNKIDNITFKPQGDALRGSMVIYEPHSFVVEIKAVHSGQTHSWKYDNFEGRTRIEPKVAKAMDITTSVAKSGVIKEIINVYGKIHSNTEHVRNISARFEGAIKSVSPSIGDIIKKGQVLARIESNESLNQYNIKAPISGVLAQRNANPGEQTNGRTLFTIINNSTVWADLAIFPSNLSRIQVGMPVKVTTTIGQHVFIGKINRINIITESNQSVIARVLLDNKTGKLRPGSFVEADIKVATHSVNLAVKRSGLQTFRDFTVVYAKIGDEYEVRMLELGKHDNDWIEVLGGLEPGTQYVSTNSYIIKADIEKSGAAHDH